MSSDKVRLDSPTGLEVDVKVQRSRSIVRVFLTVCY